MPRTGSAVPSAIWTALDQTASPSLHAMLGRPLSCVWHDAHVLPFVTDRNFQLWQATVSHQQVLLRSVKDQCHSTRVDVRFKPVYEMKLRTRLHGLSIRIADADQQRSLGIEMPRGKLFTIESQGFQGYVVASLISLHEDHGDFGDPSPLDVIGLGSPRGRSAPS